VLSQLRRLLCLSAGSPIIVLLDVMPVTQEDINIWPEVSKAWGRLLAYRGLTGLVDG